MAPRITRRGFVAAASAALPSVAMSGPSLAQPASPRPTPPQVEPLKIGVLTDVSGPYAIDTGHGSTIACQLAVEDFAASHPDVRVQVIEGDFASDPRRAQTIASRWLDDGVSAIVDVPMSLAAEAVAKLVTERDRVALFSGAASADLTGRLCGPNHVQWTYDTWALASGAARALAASGAKTWFFITADYAFGHLLEEQTTGFVKAAGGEVVGSFATPFPSVDFSDALIEAVASRADVIALANAGSETVACIRQAGSFGVTQGGQRIAGLLCQLPDVAEIGLDLARGLVTTEAYYWDRDEPSRAFAARFATRMRGIKPGMVQAGCYSATLHYLRAATAAGATSATSSGRAVVAQMKRIQTEDSLFPSAQLRSDGRYVHDMFSFIVRTPMETRYPWDFYRLERTIPASEAFRPMGDGGCSLVEAAGR